VTSTLIFFSINKYLPTWTWYLGIYKKFTIH
jgi:hypothetical protein